jgi:hypothetical protein
LLPLEMYCKRRDQINLQGLAAKFRKNHLFPPFQ